MMRQVQRKERVFFIIWVYQFRLTFLFADRNPHEIRRLAGLRFGAESQNGEHCGDRPGEYANAVWRCCFKMRRFACVAIVFNGSSRF